MEIRQIELDGQIIEYQLNFKPIKRCYLKIVSGKVVVNSSSAFSITAIEKLIRDNQQVVLKQIKNYLPKYQYINNGYVYIFNQRYQIVVRDLNQRKVAFHENKLFVYHHQVQETIERELKQILNKYLEFKIKEYLKSNFSLNMPVIQIKKLKARWGACFSNQNKVCFNLVLVHLEKELIDYVIVHELCHFIQPNHSKLFYQEVQKRLPDYKEKGVVVIGSALENGKNIAQINRYSKMAFVVGNEGNGMNPEVLAKCDDIGYIPINTIESLNVAIAGSIMMYHFK